MWYGYQPGSACIIRYQNQRLLLTAAHNVDYGNWYIICDLIQNEPDKYPIEDMNILMPPCTQKGQWRPGDLAYKTIPEDIIPLHQDDGTGVISQGTPKIDLVSDLNILPDKNRRFGFYGISVGEKRSISHQLEIDMLFLGTIEKDGYIFQLNDKHAGHEHYKRCSGAPILDDNGNLVSLLLCGKENDTKHVYGIQLAKYREYIGK
jgi:hypothetical protein